MHLSQVLVEVVIPDPAEAGGHGLAELLDGARVVVVLLIPGAVIAVDKLLEHEALDEGAEGNGNWLEIGVLVARSNPVK